MDEDIRNIIRDKTLLIIAKSEQFVVLTSAATSLIGNH